MSKSIVLGNGNILIGLDQFGQVYDFYFPYVGHENHTAGDYVHKLGVWVNGEFSWFDSGEWQIEVKSVAESLASNITAVNERLKVKIQFYDTVYNERNIFIRNFSIENLADTRRKIKLYFNQQFIIYESLRGDTAFYEPKNNVLIHYKGRRLFLMNANLDGDYFQEYSIGLLGIEGKEGTYKDAEDGQLEANPIEHGSTDSVIGVGAELEAGESKEGYYWVCAAKHFEDVQELNQYVIDKTPSYLVHSSTSYWKSWSNKQNFTYYQLSEQAKQVFKQSLLTMRAHVNNENGSIIASGDSDLLKNGRDTYSYVWPRDAAFTTVALDKAGYDNVTQDFFSLANELITQKGYFMHKYLADKSIGSSWHPWVWKGEAELPIQEDETALVIWALWKHYAISHDLEFIENIYNSLIVKAVDFMVIHRDKQTKLPSPSYDLWEERFGITTFTSAAVFGALQAAANFAEKLGKQGSAHTYRQVAKEIKEGILKYLYDEETGCFYKRINPQKDEWFVDDTVDMSSVFGVYKFGVLDVEDDKIETAIQNTTERLRISTEVGGVARYEDDGYFRVSEDLPGNPWLITSAWLAQYYVATANNAADLQVAAKQIEWLAMKASPAGMLSEQLHPFTGEALSATPLVWSHAEYVTTIVEYMEKAAELGLCDVCEE